MEPTPEEIARWKAEEREKERAAALELRAKNEQLLREVADLWKSRELWVEEKQHNLSELSIVKKFFEWKIILRIIDGVINATLKFNRINSIYEVTIALVSINDSETLVEFVERARTSIRNSIADVVQFI